MHGKYGVHREHDFAGQTSFAVKKGDKNLVNHIRRNRHRCFDTHRVGVVSAGFFQDTAFDSALFYLFFRSRIFREISGRMAV